MLLSWSVRVDLCSVRLMLLLVVLLMLLLQWLLLLLRACRCFQLCVRYLLTLMVRSSFLGLISRSAFFGDVASR